MESRHQVGLDSYDRFFPNQDTMPKGGLGNLIALQQYVGRLHRLHDAKRVVRVYDYVDFHVVMLARMYARRLKGYSVIGYRICGGVQGLASSPVQ
jgi:hypothetical protein